MVKKIIYINFALLLFTSCKQKINHEFNSSKTVHRNKVLDQDPILEAKGDLIKLIDSLKMNRNSISIHIEKLKYTMYVVHDTLLLKKYNVVFGFDPINDKLKQGDGCTPEGEFGIRAKYAHASWSKFIWIDYPSKESWNKHKRAKMRGDIPNSATIGGEVGIHGVPKGYDYIIDEKENWTLGCISLKTNDINELYEVVNSKTRIFIFK